ncbi:MAG: hypothetical protein ACLGIE_16145 [Alphaproteobacteria bacterium]
MTAGGKETDDMVQATWLYHVGQMSQEEVSRRMGLSRFKVLRLLQDARELGLVRISIEHGTTGTLVLADRLTERFSLTEAMVAPTPAAIRPQDGAGSGSWPPGGSRGSGARGRSPSAWAGAGRWPRWPTR